MMLIHRQLQSLLQISNVLGADPRGGLREMTRPAPSLRTPIGNGIDWKIGVFDSIIGYEVFDAGNNPNYTRSWGYALEPTELTGILATYRINDEVSVSAGIANVLERGINQRAWDTTSGGDLTRDWNKAYLASITFSAPSSWGWAAGSSLYGGVVYGFDGGTFFNSHNSGATGFYQDGNQVNLYAGATLNTPVKELTLGAAIDYVHNYLGGGTQFGTRWYNDDTVLGLYATYKATDKLSFNARGEYLHGQFTEPFGGGTFGYSSEAFELTGTMEYDMWVNVISRLEIRWDHFGSFRTPQAIAGDAFGFSTVDEKTSVGLYANIIYKF